MQGTRFELAKALSHRVLNPARLTAPAPLLTNKIYIVLVKKVSLRIYSLFKKQGYKT